MNNRLRPRSKSSVSRNLLPPDNDGFNKQPRNNFYLNPKAKNLRLVQPDCYKKGGFLAFRIWNMLNPEEPSELMNGRTNQYDAAGLEGCSISEPVFCCAYAGVNRDTKSHIGHDPKDCNPVSYIMARNKTQVVENVEFWEEPYIKFSKVAKDAYANGRFTSNRKWDPDWNCLLSGSNPAIPKWKQMYFVVGSVYNNGPDFDLVREHIHYEQGSKVVDKEIPRNGIPLGEASDDPVPVIALSVSAGRKLLELACRVKENYKPKDSSDPSAMYQYGDPCGKFDPATGTVKGGVFFHVYNPERIKFSDTEYHQQLARNSTYNAAAMPIGKDSQQAIVLYEAAVSSAIPGPKGILKPSLTVEQVQNITSKHLFFWRDSQEDAADSFLLHEPSIEERCVMLAKAFKFVPKLVELCWMSNPEYLAFDAVKAILNNRTQVFKPAMDETEEEQEYVEKPAAKTVSKPTQNFAEGLMDDFNGESSDDADLQDFIEPETKAKNTSKNSKSSKPVDADALMDDFDTFDSDGEIEAEAESDEQFEASDEDEEEDAISSDFDADDETDAPSKSTESDDEDEDPFLGAVNKSLSAAKALSRSSARNSKPKK